MSAKIQEQKPNELRTHCVSVRITPAELRLLDSMRGGISRGSYIRNIFLGKKIPAAVPSINRQAYIETARWAANLNQIAYALHNFGDEIQARGTEEIYAYLKKFRLKLIGLDDFSGDEKHEA
jgi:hypothetical protein